MLNMQHAPLEVEARGAACANSRPAARAQDSAMWPSLGLACHRLCLNTRHDMFPRCLSLSY